MSNSMESVLSPLPGNRPMSRNTPRVFRSPPQPHMCVQDTLKGTQITCFINVMSWCKIGVPSQQNAPIPLYGGVKVPLSDRCGISPKQVKTSKEKPLVFAVMVNPNVLKQSGKMAENPQVCLMSKRCGLFVLSFFVVNFYDLCRRTRLQIPGVKSVTASDSRCCNKKKERDGLIDLMLDFIEAMNENIKFSRNFMVLKDRDLTGELKDIWAVIQAKRDAEKIHCSQTLRDENSHPCSPQTACTPQNAKHKRSDEEEECMEASEACCQDEAGSLQPEARGDS